MIPLTDDGTENSINYQNHVTNAASFDAFQRHDEDDPLLSAEALPENSSLIDFKAFAQDYPQKLAALIEGLRPEFQEFFVEYYLLEKPQSFIGKTHGCIQTRVWQNLRIIERSIGSTILLGHAPGADILRPILIKAEMEQTEIGSLTDMILLYAATQNYVTVAEHFHVPAPTIRKILRPAIQNLMADKDVKAVAVGAYLRSLTHQASLTGPGLGKRCVARINRVQTSRFIAPPSKNSPIMEFGPIAALRETPWHMLEISSEHRMMQIFPILQEHGRKIFRKHAAQIFAPVTEDGELVFGYIFVRSTRPNLIKNLLHIRGISEMAVLTNDDGEVIKAVTVPHDDVRTMMAKYEIPETPVVHVRDFVEILTGPAARYCGTVLRINKLTMLIEVNFPTGKRFLVQADPSCVKILPNIPKDQRKFWGTRLG